VEGGSAGVEGGPAGVEDGADEGALAAAIVASSPLATIVLCPRWRVRVFNRAAERLTGRPAADVVGRDACELFPAEQAEATLARIVVASSRPEDAHLELVLAAADGRGVPAGMSWARLQHQGADLGVVGIGRDITRRKRIEHELAAMVSGLEALGAGSDLGMYRFAFTPELEVTYLSPALERGLGLTTAQLRADPSPLWERLPDDTIEQLLARRRSDGQVGGPVETRWSHPEGRTIRIEIREAPLHDEQGEVVGALGLVTDVTAQHEQQQALAETLRLEREATEELRRVDELRRLFLQAVSHELRTPLTSVLGFASTLRHRYDQLPRADALEASERILQQGQRIERLLDDLLDIERLSRGVVVLDRHELDLGDLVTAVVTEHAEPQVRVEAPTTPAYVDPGKVERIVVNLLTNAARHAGAGAEVRVRLDADPSVARLVVEDDGPGLPDELKARVFEPFEQGPRASSAASPGTGIGLTLVAEFARLHGGGAWVEDSELGGARFVVELQRGGARR
jgi:PAS domain S-box-containing protein